MALAVGLAAAAGVASQPLGAQEAARGSVTIDGPLLSYRARPSFAAPTGSLELVELPLEPRASRYLRLDSATVDIVKGLTLRYGGLPATRGYGALFFKDEPKPRLAAWLYKPANRPDGEYARASLPPFTGNWRAVVGTSISAGSATKNEFGGSGVGAMHFRGRIRNGEWTALWRYWNSENAPGVNFATGSVHMNIEELVNKDPHKDLGLVYREAAGAP